MTWQDKQIETDQRCMWEILVPTEKRIKTSFDTSPTDGNYLEAKARWEKRNSYTTRYHQVWDKKVREISGGLTVLTPAKGQWISPSGELFSERMIPVRILATRAQIDQIVDLTLEHYDQLAVLCIKISDEVILRHRCDKGCQYGIGVGMPEHRCSNGCMLEKKE